MTRFACFLRGMNLGRRRLKNDELIRCFADMGFKNVAAFLASGNVVFDTKRSHATLVGYIEKSLHSRLGYDVPTFLRSAADVSSISEFQAFTKDELGKSSDKEQVALLRTPPRAFAKRKVAAMSTAADRLVLCRSELFWLPKGNLSDSELNLKEIEATVGPMTIRTKRTVARLVAKHFAESGDPGMDRAK